MKVSGGGKVHVYDPVDEGTHPAGPQELWQESVVLLWWDQKQNIGGYYRIGHEMNAKGGPQIALWSNTCTPEGIFHKTAYLPLRPEDRTQTRFGSGDGTVSYDFDGNCIWTVEDEDLSVSIRVHDFHPSIDCYPKSGQLADFAPQHMEVAGRVSGQLKAKGKTYEIDGLGFRDHGWGERAWHTLLSHRWFSGVFGPELSFCALAWHSVDDHLIQFGWVVRNDTVTYAKDLRIIAHIEIDGLTAQSGTLRMELTTGEVLDIEFKALTPSIISFHHGIACADTLCQITMGDKVGIGDLENTNNIQQGSRKPGKLHRGIIDNGWHPAKSV